MNYSLSNIVAVCVSSSYKGVKYTPVPTYGVYEELDDTNIQNKNDFTGCSVADGATLAATSLYYNGPAATGLTGGSPMPSQPVHTDVMNGTPNVNGCGFINKTENAMLTDLLNGTAGQRVSVLFDVPTVVQYSPTSIVLNGGTSRTAPAHSIITFKNYAGVWYEEGGRASYSASAGWAPGMIANGTSVSRSINVTGATVGDFAVASLSYTSHYLVTSAQVISTDRVRVALTNLTGGSVTPPALTVYVKVDART